MRYANIGKAFAALCSIFSGAMETLAVLMMTVVFFVLFLVAAKLAIGGEHRSLAAVSLAGATLLDDGEAEPTPVKIPRSKCKACGSTGKVRTGDGLGWTECDKCEDDSGALPVAKLPDLYVYTTPGCGPCARQHADLEALGMFNLIECGTGPAWVKSYPTVHFRADNGTWRIYEGWVGVDRFLSAYAKFCKPPPLASAGAFPTGMMDQTIVDAEKQIEEILNAKLPYVPNRYVTIRGVVDLDGLPTVDGKRLVARLRSPKPVVSLAGWINAEITRIEYDGNHVMVILDGSPDYKIILR